MTTEPTARTPIAAAEGRLGIEPVLVAPDATLDELIERAGASPATRVLGVVDGSGVLVGIVTVDHLVIAVVGRLAPWALLVDVLDMEGVTRYDRYVEARVARDLMLDPAALAPTATLGDAFRAMQEHEVPGVYVVDGDGRPVGYVDGLELASLIHPGG